MYRNGDGGWLLALVLALRVSVVEAAAPDGVTAAGEKLHVVPTGNPEQLNDTDEVNPFPGVTEIVLVPLCPGTTVSDAGKAVIEKVDAQRVGVKISPMHEGGAFRANDETLPVTEYAIEKLNSYNLSHLLLMGNTTDLSGTPLEKLTEVAV